MAASDFENSRRDGHWEERQADKPADTDRGSYGATSGGRAFGSQHHGYMHEPVYRGSGEGRPDEPGTSQAWRQEGQELGRDEKHGAYRDERPDPTHRFDPDYHEWRAEQMRQLDKDYALWRHERYRKFAEEFESWRQQRFSGEHRLASSARASAAGPSSYALAGRPGSARGTSFGDAGAAGASPAVRDPARLNARVERVDRPEQADKPDRLERLDKTEHTDMSERGRGADRAEKSEKSGSLLSSLLGTGASRK